ncbi:unnamed protein product [Porites lobata]|uniref:NACHT domain-containing protein n=1 Tax=Porites lobata TaxID=104759 RepID=A0ABN8P6R2_9CNID|nr:unnamed protein product [Porites lobata]
MATSAPSPLASSVEKTNGAKLSRLLIDGGTTVLRKIFDGHHPPTNLITDLNTHYSILNNLLRRRVLNRQQWEKLFPPGGVPPESNTFDITLLFLLLTKICGLTPPPSGWHTKPPSSDKSHEANLARVKFYRNILYGHVTTTGVDTSTFSALWTEISGVLVSLGLDQAEVDRLKAEKGGEQDYIDVLIKWADSEENIKSHLMNIHHSQSQTHQAVQDVRLAQVKDQKTVKEILQSQDKTQKSVEDIQQTQAKTQKRVEDMHHIQTQTHQSVKEVNQNVREVATDLKEIKEAVYSLKEGKDKDSSDEVLRNLAKSEFSGDIEYYVQRFQKGTREWVFDRVQNWLNDRSSQNRVMVISGNAGMGKSVIAAVICKRMQEAGRLSGSHFCQYNNVRYCKPQLMIQSLACHLSHALPEYKQALVEQLSRNLGTDLNNMGVEELFALLFKEPLSAVGDPGRNMLTVIDGLDESEYKGRNELLDVIASQFCKLPIWIRFLVTTRPALNIAEKLKHLKPFELKANDKENLEDVRVFCLKRLEHVVKPANVGEFVERLVLKSEGLMLYSHFLILSITENASVFHKEDLVGSSPLGISSMYHSYFKRLERELLKELEIKEEKFLNLLSAITTSREPLPVGFVSKVLVPSTNSPLTRRKLLRALNSVSALLPVRDGCLHVIHKSVQDWLTDVSSYGEHEFIVDETVGHRILAALCTDELENLKLKRVHNIQFSATERYALYHGAYHMLHKGVKTEPNKLNELTKASILDLQIVYAKTCVNSARAAAEDLVWLKKQGIFTLLSKDNQSILDTLLFLLRRNRLLLTDTPRRFLQTILNQGGKVLTVEASNLLRNKYREIPYLEVVHNERQGGVVARFPCSSDVICLDVSPQLDYMVCECNNGMLQLWSLRTGRLVWARPVVVEKRIMSYVYRTLPSVDTFSFFRSVVFHPTKECILPGVLSQAYTMDGGLKPLYLGSTCRFSVCSISGDKTKILTNCLESSKCLVLWSLESGSEVDRILVNEDILSFAWSGDGSLLVLSHSSGVISLYDVMCNFRKLTQMATPEVCGMVKFSPDHRFIFCCAVDKVQLIHHDQSLFCLKVVKEANNRFSLTIVSRDSETFESFNDCGFLFGDLISTKGPQHLLTFGLDTQRLLRSVSNLMEMADTNYVNRNDQGEATAAAGIALSLDGQTVFVASVTSVTAYDASSRKRKAEINCGVLQYHPLCPVRGGDLFLTRESKKCISIELWSGNLAKRIKRWTNLPGVKQLVPLSEERLAVVGEVDVKILDPSSGKVVSTIAVSQGTVLSCNSKCQLLVQRKFERCVFISYSCLLQLFDGETLVWKKEGSVSYYQVVAFSPTEQFLVVGTCEDILVLDAETGNTLHTLHPPSLLSHCTFISDDVICVIYNYNSTVGLFNVKSGELLTEVYVEDDVTCLAACPFNSVLAIGLENSTPNFKVIRAHLPRVEGRGNMER